MNQRQDLSETWSPGIEYILEEIRLNSIAISEHHKEKYYYSKGYLKYFRIPTIIFSALNSVFSVGLQPYCPQPIISLICCIISLVCGVISSVELFLSIQSTMENELIASKDFYLLSVDIFKILSLEPGTRMINGKVYLDETYQTYCKLIENSNIVSAEMKNMIEPSKHLQFSPKLLSSTKEEVAAEIHSITSSLASNKRLNNKRNDEKEESPQNILCHFDEEEEEYKENENSIELGMKGVSFLSHLDIQEEAEKETTRIIEMEENNQSIHLAEEEAKEQIPDDIIVPEEKLASELTTKTKRKYTKKPPLKESD
jgi:hypothetical protein